jgi:hypothetical protein
LTVHTPFTAKHCRAVRQTSDGVQSASLAAVHAAMAAVHLPAKAHCVDFLQSALSSATQRPFSA